MDTEKVKARNHQSVSESCQFIKVTVKASKLAGATVARERYIPRESKRYAKHEQLKQANIEQRKRKDELSSNA